MYKLCCRIHLDQIIYLLQTMKILLVSPLLAVMVMMPAVVKSILMTPGQEKMFKKKDLNKIIMSHGLHLPASSRTNRDIDNHIDNGQIDAGVPLPPGMRLPGDIPEGFDLSSVEPQEDGQFCVFKKIELEGIEKIPVQQCVHKVYISIG